jgi:hypothetical protein
VEIRRHLTYANVAATLALAGLIDSGDIANNSIRSQDLRNRAAVGARDVQRNALTGREIRDYTLEASDFAPLRGDQAALCDPIGLAFESCVATTVQLKSRSRLLVFATGDFYGDGTARLACRIVVDEEAANSVSPGETSGTTDLSHTEGFATTHVSERLPRGPHTASLECSEPEADGALASSSIAVLGITG